MARVVALLVVFSGWFDRASRGPGYDTVITNACCLLVKRKSANENRRYSVN